MKNNQNEILELKDMMIGMKSVVESFNIRLKKAEERTHKLGDRPFEIIQSGGKMEKNKESLWDLWDTKSRTDACIISHANKVMLKILQARLQQCMNQEFPDVQARFRKGRGTRDQIDSVF